MQLPASFVDYTRALLGEAEYNRFSAALLEAGDRRLTGPTVPPQGLALTRIWYEGAVGEMMSR